MKVKEKVFPCLSCGSDTGCPNKLICDRCKELQKHKPVLARSHRIKQEKSRFRLRPHI
jgi:hypothetical protein